jgi:hypothetical protein
MKSSFNSSYMVMSSLTYVQSFFVKFFFQSIYTDFAYFEREKSTLKSSASETWAEMI